MNHRTIIVFDFETTARSKYTCELTQIAAVAIHPRRLTIIDSFNSECKPLDFDAIEDEALKVTKKTKEGLAKAPHIDQVWKDFANYVNSHNFKKTEWYSPIAAGYNITGYDWEILNRYARKYGDVNDKNEQKLFSNFVKYDLMEKLYWWTENSNELENLQLVTLREHMGLPTDKAHDALNDVLDTAKILIKFMQLDRNIAPKVKTKGAFAHG